MTAVDKLSDASTDWRQRSSFNRHFHVMADDITATKLRQTVALITCISVLEHIPQYDLAVRTMFNLIDPGGHLILTFPYNERADVARLSDLPEFRGGSYGSVTRVFSRAEVDGWLKQARWELAAQEYYQLNDGMYYGTGKMITPPMSTHKDAPYHLTCIVLRKQPN